jgi:hypothetical protein
MKPSGGQTGKLAEAKDNSASSPRASQTAIDFARRLSRTATGKEPPRIVVRYYGANKRPPRQIKLFRQGELGRLILDVLRQATGPVSTYEVTTAIMRAGGHGEDARRAVSPRVRGNLSYLERRGAIRKGVDGKLVHWSLEAVT